ncbi:MAG: hypothetical protein Q9207_008071, partial [Kuettlingeria erythrocarpa]
MTAPSLLITTPPMLQTHATATGKEPSTASKSDEMELGSQDDHSDPKADASPPPASGNVLISNLASQFSSAPAAPQRPPEPSMTGTSGTAINNAGLENQEPVFQPVMVGYTPSVSNQAPEGPGPTLSSVVRPATVATNPAIPPSLEDQSLASLGRLTTADSALQFVIGSHSLTPGAPGITIDENLVSLQPSATAFIVGSSTVPLAPPPEHEIFTVNGLSFSRGPGSDLVFGTQTIRPGVPAVSISGTPVSMAEDGAVIVVGSSTAPLPAAATQGFVVADAFTFSRGSGSDLVIGTQTITPGAPAVTISGTPVSFPVGATAVVVGGSTIPLLGLSSASNTPPVTLNINGMSLTALPGSNYLVGSQTLTPGKPAITVNGTPVSLAVGGTAVIAGDSTIPLSASTTTPAVLAINRNTYTAISRSTYLISSQTLIPGGPTITISGTPISLPLDVTVVVVGDSTLPVTDSTPTVPGPTSTPAVLTINGNRYTELSNSAFLIGYQTLVPGGSAITISGTPISLPLDATAVVIGDSTLPIPVAPTTTPPVLEFDGHTYTQQISGSGFLIGTQTLVPGGTAITVNGTLVSLGKEATHLVVGTQTAPLTTTTTSRGLGEVIMGGFESGGPGGQMPTGTGGGSGGV